MRKKLSARASSRKMYAATRPPAPPSPCLFSRGRLHALRTLSQEERMGKKEKSPGEHVASTWAPAALVPSLVKRTGHFRRDVCVARCRGDALSLSPSANLKWRLSPRRGRASCRWALAESRSPHRLPLLPLWTAAAASKAPFSLCSIALRESLLHSDVEGEKSGVPHCKRRDGTNSLKAFFCCRFNCTTVK